MRETRSTGPLGSHGKPMNWSLTPWLGWAGGQGPSAYEAPSWAAGRLMAGSALRYRYRYRAGEHLTAERETGCPGFSRNGGIALGVGSICRRANCAATRAFPAVKFAMLGEELSRSAKQRTMMKSLRYPYTSRDDGSRGGACRATRRCGAIQHVSHSPEDLNLWWTGPRLAKEPRS